MGRWPSIAAVTVLAAFKAGALQAEFAAAVVGPVGCFKTLRVDSAQAAVPAQRRPGQCPDRPRAAGGLPVRDES